jgi:hypothetical protein
MEPNFYKSWRRYLNESRDLDITPDLIYQLRPTTSEDGISGAIFSKGILKYKDEQDNNITLDLTSIPGATSIRLSGNVNIDVNSTLFGYLKDYSITLTTQPDNTGMVTGGRELETIVNNDSSKFIQFVNPAADDETILIIRTKRGKYEMLYLNIIEK